MEVLDPKQYEAATSKSSRVLCDSKAGSGKTKTLMNRCLYLLDNGFNPEQIVLITFTNKASQEMMRRIRSLTPLGGRILCGTFHNIALMFLKVYGYLIDYDENFSVITPDDSEKLIKEFIKEFEQTGVIDDEFTKKNKPTKILGDYSYSRNLNISFEEYLEVKNYTYGDIKVVLRLIELYEIRKLTGGLMDFDDLLSNFLRILSVPEVYQKITSQYKHVLVDEYQDINIVQYAIIEKLLNDNNLFVVGDPIQSIYNFRGSRMEYITRFDDFFDNPHIVSLNNNYRSTQEILDLGAEATGGMAKMNAIKGSGKKPDLYIARCRNYYENPNEKIAKDIASKIRDLIKSGVDSDEIAVLARSNNQLFLLEAELNKYNISYVMRAGFSYFEKAHIKDTLNFLTTLTNKKNKECLSRSLGLFKGLGPKAINTVIDNYNACGNNIDLLYQRMNDKTYKVTTKVQTGFNDFYKLQSIIKSKTSIEDKLNYFLNSFYANYLEENYQEDFESRQSEILALTKISKNFKTIDEFVNSVMIDTSINNKESGENKSKVVISTIHRAKGLEWDHVFICNMEQTYKSPNKVTEDETTETFKVDEDSRLLYVAITRAKKELFLYVTENEYNSYRETSRVNLTHKIRNLRKLNKNYI